MRKSEAGRHPSQVSRRYAAAAWPPIGLKAPATAMAGHGMDLARLGRYVERRRQGQSRHRWRRPERGQRNYDLAPQRILWPPRPPYQLLEGGRYWGTRGPGGTPQGQATALRNSNRGAPRVLELWAAVCWTVRPPKK